MPFVAVSLCSYFFQRTSAVTAEFAAVVNVQLRVFLPLLEHAPDQTASRVLVNPIDVPFLNDAAAVLPVVTSMPDGVDVRVARLGAAAASRESRQL